MSPRKGLPVYHNGVKVNKDITKISLIKTESQAMITIGSLVTWLQTTT